MMGFIYIFVAVLSVLSVGQSAPVTGCESLIQPIEIQGRDQLLGMWNAVAEATDIPMSRELTNMFVDSAWGRLTAADQSDEIDVHQVQKMFDSCFKIKTKMTLKNSVLSLGQVFNATSRLLSTGCPDCLVLLSKYKIGKSTYSGVQLLSTRTQVSAAELEEFKKQVECLNFSPPAILSQEKGLCLDDSSVTDLTPVMAEMGPKITSLMESLLDRGNLMEMITSLLSD